MSIDIVVLEDNPLNQKLLVRFLESHEYRVHVAENTVEAERVLASVTPGVMLVDVSLPGEDGLSFVRRLREGGARFPVVAVTAHAMAGDRERALEAGGDAYLAKPVDLQALRSLIAGWMGKERVV